MSDIQRQVKRLNDEVDGLALGIMEQIRCSEDEVSKALAPILAKAVPHSSEELQRARDRKELGNPPGKSVNPIGDQLTWEQILTHFEGKKRLWIISRDGDYGTVYSGKGFLNQLLYDELCKVSPEAEVYLFQDMVEGIKHFVDTTGVKAEKRLTSEEEEEIEKEEKSLPPLNSSLDDIDRVIDVTNNISYPLKDVNRMFDAMNHASRAMDVMKHIPPPLQNINEAFDVLKNIPNPLTNIDRMFDAMNHISPPLKNIPGAFNVTNCIPELPPNVAGAFSAINHIPDLPPNVAGAFNALDYVPKIPFQNLVGGIAPNIASDPMPYLPRNNRKKNDKQPPTSPQSP
jgi:hypothetical protein